MLGPDAAAAGQLSTIERPGDPKAVVIHPFIRRSREPVSRAKVPVHVPPGAATQHSVAAIAAGPGATVAGRTVVAIVPAVLDPLPDVAMHVEQPPGIGAIAADLAGPAKVVAVVRVVRRDLVAPRVARPGASPAGVFPFRLGQQAV